MKVIVQRVSNASVKVNNEIVSKIDNGFLLLVGITHDDDKSIVEKVANKVCKLRVFEDDEGKMNLDINKVNGKILSISQFTLYGDVKKGNRPSFTKAARPEYANELYEYFNDCIRNNGIECLEGVFQADMKVSLINDGPVTIIVDSDCL
ncbi:MAG: D-aminoacyl-tRNA deacylase [Erysipelotrichaceae bacterium]|jgi:D-tyrosyl-tRNA(Tyr) deacylase|nr:D-aminoacyl-tRNA deacylase [Bacillota bacterium]NLP22184.1 D-tyrosyl-tRNA(Tyr) deacylase [Erysipelotrichaceae bacterium]HCY05818.1 D-tyrosyl-tRNA(Tyr) deacylase [Erysipelotrichaceae bacterium]